MSYMKREFEKDHPEIFGALRCLVCAVEATPELKGRRVSDEGWLCHAHIAEAPCEPCGQYGSACVCPDIATEGYASYRDEESDEDRFFAQWAGAMVRAEVSRGMFDDMWERIKVKLDDLHKVEALIADVFGHRARMVER